MRNDEIFSVTFEGGPEDGQRRAMRDPPFILRYHEIAPPDVTSPVRVFYELLAPRPSVIERAYQLAWLDPIARTAHYRHREED